MSRVACLLLLLLLFCGCTGTYREAEGWRIVSALGVDQREGRLVVTAELITQQQGADSAVKPLLVSGSGDSLREALLAVAQEIPQSLFWKHCPIVIVGEGLTAAQTEELVCTGLESEGLSLLSSRLVSTDDVDSLLTCEGSTSPILGFELLAQILAKRQNPGMDAAQSLAELAGRSDFALPRFSVSVEQDGTRRALMSGQTLYRASKPTGILGAKRSALLHLLRGKLRQGTLCCQGELSQSLLCRVVHTSRTISLRYQKEVPVVAMNLRVTPSSGEWKGLDQAAFETALVYDCTALLDEIYHRQGVDLLNLAEALGKSDAALAQRLSRDLDWMADIEFQISCTFLRRD